MAISWSSDLPIHTTMFMRKNLSRSGGATVTGIEQVVQSVSDFWVATIRFKIHRRNQILAYRALQAQNFGRVGQWIVPACPTAGLPQGDFSSAFDTSFSGDVDPTVVDAKIGPATAFGARTVIINAGFLPKAGMLFSVGNRLHVIAAVTSLGSNNYSATIAPGLRASIFANTPADFITPKCLMRLAQDDVGQMTLDQLRFADVTLDFVEVQP